MAHRVISATPLPIDVRPLLGDVELLELPPEPSRWEEVTEVVGLISPLTLPVTDDVMRRLPALRVVANYAVGYDNIDVAAASRRGVVVSNTPDVLTDATADLTFALILGACRRVGEAERLLRSGRWEGWAPGLLLGMELLGKRLGIVGAGRIGCAVLRRARGFGLDLVYASRSPSREAEELGARRVELETLLATSDIVSLHVPLTAETESLLNDSAIRSMKEGSVLINTARGGCVDHAALARHLRSGHLAGAGIDVFPEEPQIPEELLACETALLVPHIGSATFRARGAMARLCALAVTSVLDGAMPANAVNGRDVDLSRRRV